MKPKFLYAAMLLVCIALFTSAKQATSLCMADIKCTNNDRGQSVKDKQVTQDSFDLSPLGHFIFSLSNQ